MVFLFCCFFCHLLFVGYLSNIIKPMCTQSYNTCRIEYGFSKLFFERRLCRRALKVKLSKSRLVWRWLPAPQVVGHMYRNGAFNHSAWRRQALYFSPTWAKLVASLIDSCALPLDLILSFFNLWFIFTSVVRFHYLCHNLETRLKEGVKPQNEV